MSLGWLVGPGIPNLKAGGRALDFSETKQKKNKIKINQIKIFVN